MTVKGTSYSLKQKLVSLGSNFTIRDAEGRVLYEIRGEFPTLYDKLAFKDTAGNELVWIEQKVVNWFGMYEIRRDGKLLADVKRDFLAFFRRRRFTIETGGTNDLEAIGDFFDLEFIVKRGDLAIARFTKQWFRLSDTWGIEIDDKEQDHVFLLAVAVVIARTRQRTHART